jgi:hypothetical protein
MSDTENKDHWLDLANEIGADVPEEQVADQPSTDEAGPETEAVEESTRDIDEVPAPEAESAEVAAEIVTDGPETEAVSPAPAKPAEAAPSHWYELASSLGLDVPEPEPEPEPAPAPEPGPTTDELAMVEHAEQAVEPQDTTAVAATDERGDSRDSSGEELTDTSPPDTAGPEGADLQPRPEDDLSASTPSLFEHPDLQLDAPGVLDAVFDGDEDAVFSAIVDTKPSRDLDSSTMDEEEVGDTSSEFALEVEEFAEEGRGAEEPVAEDGNVEDSESADEERRGRRRKRRRRRKPSRRERDEADDGTGGAEVESEDRISEDEPIMPEGREKERRPRRRDDEETPPGKAKHKKIPTWDEAVGFVIASNVENRSKTSNYSSRGRGGRRGRR